MKWRATAMSAGAALAVLLSNPGQAATVHQTFTGTLATDDAVRLFSLALGQTSDLSVSTNSYGGGALDGSVTPAGGFVPILSLFAPNGNFIASDGADIHAPGAVDPATGVSDDAALSANGLAPGVYTLAVSEFFNFPNGNLSDGFFAAGQGNFTGPTCNRPNGAFLQTNLVSCPQRTDAFALNVAITAVPEPSTYALLILAFAGGGCALRRRRYSSMPGTSAQLAGS